MIVLDLARVDRIDAAGLGVLLDVREWARSGTSVFKLMNVTKKVEEILELTHLQNVFEFCSVRDFFCLLHRAASMPSWSPINLMERMNNDTCNGSVKWQEAGPSRGSLSPRQRLEKNLVSSAHYVVVGGLRELNVASRTVWIELRGHAVQPWEIS
jgi:hypothetical protein